MLHIRDTIRLEDSGHSVAVQEGMPLTFNWWLMLLCPASSPTCDLAFTSFLCSLPSCVVQGTTVSRKTSLSNFKRAQFPSKTCTRTDYPLLAWFFQSPVGVLILCSFQKCFTLLQHVITIVGKRGGHQNEILSRQVCIVLALIFTKGTWVKLHNRLSWNCTVTW